METKEAAHMYLPGESKFLLSMLHRVVDGLQKYLNLCEHGQPPVCN